MVRIVEGMSFLPMAEGSGKGLLEQSPESRPVEGYARISIAPTTTTREIGSQDDHVGGLCSMILNRSLSQQPA